MAIEPDILLSLSSVVMLMYLDPQKTQPQVSRDDYQHPFELDHSSGHSTEAPTVHVCGTWKDRVGSPWQDPPPVGHVELGSRRSLRQGQKGRRKGLEEVEDVLLGEALKFKLKSLSLSFSSYISSCYSLFVYKNMWVHIYIYINKGIHANL